MASDSDKQNNDTSGTGRSVDNSRCSNCYRKYTKSCLPTRQFYYEFYENGALVTKNVLISEAIKEIFEWRLFGFSEHAMDEYFTSTSQFRVCGSICGVAIAKLYGAIKVFDSLAHSNSFMDTLTTKTLDKFISYATSHNLVGSPTAKGKLVPNLLTRKPKGKKNQIGTEILNRPITQHVKLGNALLQNQDQTLIDDPMIRVLDPNDYQVVQDVHDDPVLVEIQRGLPTLTAAPADNKLELNSYSCSVDDLAENNADDWIEEEIEYSETFNVSKPFLCQLCGAGLTSRQGLRTHELLSHKIANGKEKIWPCPHCDKEFFFEYLLKNHLPRHAPVRDFACSKCDLKFKGRIALRQHVKDVHDTVERKYACKICPNKSFKHQRTLWDHNRSHHGNKGKKIIFACKYGCGSTTARSRSLLQHHRICLKRPRDDDEQLDVALKSIGGNVPEEELEKMDDGGKRVKIYSCPFDCGKTFTTKTYRNRHSKKLCKKSPNYYKLAANKQQSAPPKLAVRPVKSTKKDEKSSPKKIMNKSVEESTPSSPKTEAATLAPVEQTLDDEEILPDTQVIEQDDLEVEGMIEVETVFDDTIVVP